MASRSYSCLPKDLPYQVLRSRSISLDCSSFYLFVEPLRDPIAGSWLSDTSLPRLIIRLSPGHGHHPSA